MCKARPSTLEPIVEDTDHFLQGTVGGHKTTPYVKVVERPGQQKKDLSWSMGRTEEWQE